MLFIWNRFVRFWPLIGFYDDFFLYYFIVEVVLNIINKHVFCVEEKSCLVGSSSEIYSFLFDHMFG